MEHMTMKFQLSVSIMTCVSILLLVACISAPASTTVAVLPTDTPYPTSYTPYLTLSPTLGAANTPTAIPLPTATSLPDFVLPGARTKYTFKQIVPLLSSPQLVSLFMKNNVKLDGDYDNRVCGGNYYYPASLVYQNGIDDSDGHAILQCYILEKTDGMLT
jgi:hypothetical protein